MDYHKPLDLLHTAREAEWVNKVNQTRVDGSLCTWATTFHPRQLPCRLDGGFMNGSYNLSQRVTFTDGTTWLLRLPRVHNISSDYADEKVAMEVEALSLIREKTSIPVPDVYAWGPASENPLGLGPFIVMSFIDGISLNDVLGDRGSRLLKVDISDTNIERVYRQLADFMIQLFDIDFDRLGSLPSTETGFVVPIRPLTWKTHEILHVGGVNTFGDRTQGFSSTREYFEHLNSQDKQQLRLQLNSIAGPRSARSRYASLELLKNLIPDLIHPKYDSGPFKVICDDFGPANMIVRSKDDLTIVGVIDLEWTYVGPAQLFGSAPWWLLLDRPVNEEWDFEGREAPKATDRYFHCLDIFQRVLAEQESNTIDGQTGELSELVQWSVDSGAMWLHMLLSSGFFDDLSFPCMQLRKCKGIEWWDSRIDEYGDAEDVEPFIAKKLHDLESYDQINEEVEKLQILMDGNKLSSKKFIEAVTSLLTYD